MIRRRPVTCTHDVFPPKPAAAGPVTGTDPRTPQKVTRTGSLASQWPKHDHRPMQPADPTSGSATTSTSTSPEPPRIWNPPTPGRPSRNARVTGRFSARKVPPRLVERADLGPPLRQWDRPGLLEQSAEELRRGVIEEHDRPLDIDQHRGQRDQRNEVARQDQLERLPAASAVGRFSASAILAPARSQPGPCAPTLQKLTEPSRGIHSRVGRSSSRRGRGRQAVSTPDGEHRRRAGPANLQSSPRGEGLCGRAAGPRRAFRSRESGSRSTSRSAPPSVATAGRAGSPARVTATTDGALLAAARRTAPLTPQ